MSRRRVRLSVDDDLGQGAVIALKDDSARYLLSVLRLGSGAEVLLFNGRDGEWRSRLAVGERGACRLQVEARVRAQAPESGPSLVFVPVKKSALDMIVEKATELGVSRLIPVRSRFATVERLNRARLLAQVREAAEQCGRLTLPTISELVPLERAIAAWPGECTLFMMDERGGGEPIAAAFARDHAGRLDACSRAIIVGPEGGFSPEEAEHLSALPFVRRVSLGPRILRAETAAVAALACWQALAGDWSERPWTLSAAQQG